MYLSIELGTVSSVIVHLSMFYVIDQEASRIRQEASRTKKRAEDLKDNADLLGGDVNDSEEQVSNLRVQADNDYDLADNVSSLWIYRCRNR